MNSCFKQTGPIKIMHFCQMLTALIVPGGFHILAYDLVGHLIFWVDVIVNKI